MYFHLQHLIMTKIAIIGDYNSELKPHIATDESITHSCRYLNLNITADWVSTVGIDNNLFAKYSGIWVAPGSPYKNIENVIWAIKQARENNFPCLGTCGGFQHMILEYARNVLNIKDAQHAEYNSSGSEIFISELKCSLAGREMKISFSVGAKVTKIYGYHRVTEQYYCNFGVNPEKINLLKSGPLRISGSDEEGEVRVIEHPDLDFFIGTLFVPQVKSKPNNPHPLVNAFLEAVAHQQITLQNT